MAWAGSHVDKGVAQLSALSVSLGGAVEHVAAKVRLLAEIAEEDTGSIGSGMDDGGKRHEMSLKIGAMGAQIAEVNVFARVAESHAQLSEDGYEAVVLRTLPRCDQATIAPRAAQIASRPAVLRRPCRCHVRACIPARGI